MSVVVPAYNNSQYIEQTLESILAQTYQDFELIVADHSSTDTTWAQIQRFAADPRVQLLTTPAGGGARRNWNRVSQAATGDLIKLVCGDDLLYPTMLERQVEALDAAGDDVALTATRRDVVDGQGRMFLRSRGLRGMSGLTSGADVLRGIVRSGANPLGEPACVMFRRSALESAGWWDDTFPFYIDVGTYARVLMSGDLVGIDEPLAAFRVSASQWSVRLSQEQYRQAAGFHSHAHQLAPEHVRPRDVRLGNLLARKAAAQRRLAYVWLGARMRPATVA